MRKRDECDDILRLPSSEADIIQRPSGDRFRYSKEGKGEQRGPDAGRARALGSKDGMSMSSINLRRSEGMTG